MQIPSQIFIIISLFGLFIVPSFPIAGRDEISYAAVFSTFVALQWYSRFLRNEQSKCEQK